MTIISLSKEAIAYRKSYLKGMKKFEIHVRVELRNGHFDGILESMSLTSDEYHVGGCKFFEGFNKFHTTNLIKKSTNTKNNDEKGDNKMTNSIEKTQNGVQFFALEVANSTAEAQDIFDVNAYTTNIDADCAYSERVENGFVGTYLVRVERADDYARFTKMAGKEKRHIYAEKEAVRSDWYNDRITGNEYTRLMDELCEKESNCDCKLCNSTIPTFEEWKSGKMSNGAKVGKTMRKMGYSQQLLDFYSQQIKTEKDVYLTVSDRAQHIAGMSYYCKMGTWDGMNGSSCQDTRHEDEEYPLKLAGSLHDNKLFVGMLHDSIEDLEDMTDKLVARTMFRFVHVDQQPCLVATEYYGNNETKDLLHNTIEKLSSFDIFSKSAHGCDRTVEKANGVYSYTMCDEVNIEETIDEYEMVDCPMCDGSGEYEVYSERLENHVEVDCPACNGSGRYEVNVYIEVDEYVEIEDEKELKPYAEEYDHHGTNIVIWLDNDHIRHARGQMV